MVMKNKLFTATAIGTILFGLQANAAQIERNTAQMQAMDKITGRVSVVEVPVNGEVKFGSFSIVVRACKATPPEETPENYAFVDVADSSFGKMQFNIFKGWMMSSSPALNAVEHPIYDVWLLKCIDTKVDQSKLLSEEQLKERDALPRLADIKQESGEQVSEPMPAEEEKTTDAVKENVLEEGEAKVLDNFTNPSAAEEQKVEDKTWTLNEAAQQEQAKENVENVSNLAAENAVSDGPQSLLNIVEMPKEQVGNDVPAAVEPAEANTDWVELPPAEEKAVAPVQVQAETAEPQALIVSQPSLTENEPAKSEAANAEKVAEEAPKTDEVIGSAPEGLPEDEEDQFIDFSGQADDVAALEAELSAEALKD